MLASYAEKRWQAPLSTAVRFGGLVFPCWTTHTHTHKRTGQEGMQCPCCGCEDGCLVGRVAAPRTATCPPPKFCVHAHTKAFSPPACCTGGACVKREARESMCLIPPRRRHGGPLALPPPAPNCRWGPLWAIPTRGGTPRPGRVCTPECQRPAFRPSPQNACPLIAFPHSVSRNNVACAFALLLIVFFADLHFVPRPAHTSRTFDGSAPLGLNPPARRRPPVPPLICANTTPSVPLASSVCNRSHTTPPSLPRLIHLPPFWVRAYLLCTHPPTTKNTAVCFTLALLVRLAKAFVRNNNRWGHGRGASPPPLHYVPIPWPPFPHFGLLLTLVFD